MSETESKSSIQVIDRMMNLLNALAAQPEPQGLKQLATRTGLHSSSAYRILGVMVEKGLAERMENGNYQLGIKLLELGNLVKARLNVRQVALPYMQALHEKLGETVNLIVRQGDEMVYVERAFGGKSMVQVVQVIGARAPMHITAAGKIFLADEGPGASQALAERTGLPRYTPNTLTTVNALQQEVDAARQNGFAYDNEEAEKSVCCVSAGIRDSSGRLVAALSVSAPAERFVREWSAEVRQTADAISAGLGYHA